MLLDFIKVLPLLLLPVFLTILYAVMLKRSGGPLRSLLSRLEDLGGQKVGWRRYVFNVDGVQIWAGYLPSAQDENPFVMSVDMYGLSMRVTENGALHRLSEKFGMEQKITTDDEAFDVAFHVACKDAESAHRYLMSAERRTAIEELFKNRAFHIEFSERGLLVFFSQPLLGSPDTSFVTNSLPNIAILAKGPGLSHVRS